MPGGLSGPQLDKAVKLTQQWYAETRQRLIKALEEHHPYGTVEVSPTEQYQSYLEMTPEDWDALIAQLQNRYRGLPNVRELVDKDLARYVARMHLVGSKLGNGGGLI